MLNIFYRLIALTGLIFVSPILFLLYMFVKNTSNGPFFYKQKRMGKNMKPFTLYKIRTMIEDADKQKKKYINLNEVDGPVFKIKNDPRYTKIGKFLSHTGLDEIPQLINVIKGEMSFVGPRPLPVEEAFKVPLKYRERFSVLPGITSTWILEGAHAVGFEKWMKLDVIYIKEKTIWLDILILVKTAGIVFKLTIRNLKQVFSYARE